MIYSIVFCNKIWDFCPKPAGRNGSDALWDMYGSALTCSSVAIVTPAATDTMTCRSETWSAISLRTTGTRWGLTATKTTSEPQTTSRLEWVVWIPSSWKPREDRYPGWTSHSSRRPSEPGSHLKASQVPGGRRAHLDVWGKNISCGREHGGELLLFHRLHRFSQQLRCHSPLRIPLAMPNAMLPAPMKPIFLCRSTSGSILICYQRWVM